MRVSWQWRGKKTIIQISNCARAICLVMSLSRFPRNSCVKKLPRNVKAAVEGIFALAKPILIYILTELASTAQFFGTRVTSF